MEKSKQEKTTLIECDDIYKQLFENSGDALMTIVSPTWKFESVNKACLKLFGVSSEDEFITLGPWDLSPSQQPDGTSSVQKAQEMIDIVMSEGSNFFEWEHQTIDGKVFMANVMLTRLEIDGKILVQATVRDISKSKQMETLLKQERDFSTRLIDNAPVLIVTLDKEGKIVRFNRFLEELTGYSIAEVRGKDWFEIFLSEDQVKEIKTVFLNSINDIPTNGHINPILMKDGTQKMIEWYNKTLKDTHNNTIGLISIGIDITERLEEEKQLKLFRTMIDHANDSIEIIEPDTMQFLDVNKRGCEVLGYTKEEMLSMGVFDIDPSLDADMIKAKQRQFYEEKKLNVISNHRRKDGSIFPVEINAVLVELDKPYMLSIVRDITERKHTEQILLDSEEKFRSITASAQDAIIMMDNKGEISYWNEAAQKIFGYSQKEAMGQNLHTFITPQRFLAAHKVGFEHFKNTGEGPAVGKTVELTGLKKGGIEFPLELSLSSTKIDGLWNAIGIIRDISERKEMANELKCKEEMMLAQSKQAAMGDMIAMIAHQWRQPLAVISMDLNNLRASIELEEEITTDELVKHADSVYTQLHQLSETIDNFRNFFKPDQLREEITVADALNSTLNIVGASLNNNNITLNIKNSVKSSLFINKSSLMQVLLNIIGNAKDIFISKKVPEATIDITVKENKEVITISICDNAGGIQESIIDKMGHPYFTTKQSLNGTGLGLYISRTIVEKHLCGTLTWHNKNKGACFIIRLSIKDNESK